MSAATLILRIIVATTTLITVGTIGVFGFTVLEPFYAAFGDPPSSLQWGDPATTTIAFASFGIIGLLLVLTIWFISAPIRRDRRQQFR